ncbi:MAG: DNA polymerase Y family protein [Polyangiales bacterium]
MACIDVPDLPLQMLVRAHPRYRGAPVAVVAEERPEAPLLLLNAEARAMRLATGMRFGAAKSLVPELCAGAVTALEVEQLTAELVKALQTFSPHVERDPSAAGVFYVDPSGLEHLYGGELGWAECVVRALRERGLDAAAVVAHGRALAYALVRVLEGRDERARVWVIATPEEALARAHEVPLERLAITAKLLRALGRLGLATLGDLAGLGADRLALRFGAEAARWCAVARGEEVLPLGAEPHVTPPRASREVEPPDDDVARLCFVIKQALDALLEDLRSRGVSVRALWLRLALERGGENVQRLEPSQPTRNGPLLLELLRLRLSAVSLGDRVSEVTLEADPSDAAQGQLAMFTPRRDVAAGERALARLKASYGADVVCRAVMEDAHLPEARYRWVDLTRLALPVCSEADPAAPPGPLVRRVLPRPEPLRGSLEEGCLVHRGVRLSLTGPYRVSGGWWVREITRDYYYARTPEGALWWVFFDAPRGGWFLHAVVD